MAMLKKITFTIASESNLWHPEEEQATLSWQPFEIVARTSVFLLWIL
jgi:hypothetical protein